jgi:hypothetical protein
VYTLCRVVRSIAIASSVTDMSLDRFILMFWDFYLPPIVECVVSRGCSRGEESVDSLYVYQTSFGLASGQVLRRSQGILLPLSVNLRYRIRGTMCNARSNLISGKQFDLEKGFYI